MASSGRGDEPVARDGHAAFAIGQKMMLLAGDGCESHVVDTFNIFSMAWKETITLRRNDAPDRLCYMAAVSDGKDTLYTFAGYTKGGRRINSLYELNVSSMQCTEIVPATGNIPSPRDSSSMILYDRLLLAYGGRTDDGVSSELLVFNLHSSERCIVVYVMCLSLVHYPLVDLERGLVSLYVIYRSISFVAFAG